MRRGIIIGQMSFYIEKDKSGLPVAHRHLKSCIRRELFEDELAERRPQWSRKRGRVSRYESHGARLRPAQGIIKDKDREERIGAHLKSQGLPLRFSGPRGNSIEPVQIEIH